MIKANLRKRLIPAALSFAAVIALTGTISFISPGIGGTAEPADSSPVVALIGDMEITADEFRKNYEYGLPHLKAGATTEERKLNYLRLMINEKIIAREGYDRGYDELPSVKQNRESLELELITEAFIRGEITDEIEITPEEIDEAINKSKVSFKYRYWIEPTRERAELVAAAINNYGYDNVVDEILNLAGGMQLTKADLESEYTNWLETPAEIVEAVKPLEPGDVAQPVEINEVWYIIQLIDFRREFVSSLEYDETAPSMKKVLKARETEKRFAQYVDDLMSPMNIKTKGDSFRLFSDAVRRWLADSMEVSLSDAVITAGLGKPELYTLQQRSDKTMVTYSGGRFTIADMLEMVDMTYVTSLKGERLTFRQAVNDAIALSLRDHFLAREAERLGYQRDSRVEDDLKSWTDKWVYKETRERLLTDISVTDEEITGFFDANRNRYKITSDDQPQLKEHYYRVRRDAKLAKARTFLEKHIDELETQYPVEIDTTVLSNIEVIDFKKSRWASVQLVRGGTGRLAVPMVDAAWAL